MSSIRFIFDYTICSSSKNIQVMNLTKPQTSGYLAQVLNLVTNLDTSTISAQHIQSYKLQMLKTR